MTINKFEVVVDVWDQTAGIGSWNLNFIKDFNNWRVDMVINLLSMLQKESVSCEPKKVSWKGVATTKFLVCDAFKMLTQGTCSLFSAKNIWLPRVPTKVTFFAWEAS